MTVPKYPTNDVEALAYAVELAELHGKPWIAIKRIQPINNRFAINFAAIEQDELVDYVEQWKLIDSV